MTPKQNLMILIRRYDTMRKYMLFILVSALAAVPLLVGSCSKSDDKGNGGNNTIVGDPNDASFLRVRSVFGPTAAGMATMAVTTGMSRYSRFDTTSFGFGGLLGTKASNRAVRALSGDLGDSVSIVYHRATGWWVGYFSVPNDTFGSISLSFLMHDSLQFKDVNNHNQMLPDSTTDYFRDIINIDHLTIAEDTIGHGTVTARSDMTYQDLQATNANATVDGTYRVTFSGELRDTASNSMISGSTVVTFTMAKLVVPIVSSTDTTATACPSSGVISYEFSEDYISQMTNGQKQSNTWKVVINIVDQHTYKVQVTLGNVEWQEYTITDACLGLSAPKSLVESLVGMLKRI